MMTMRYFPWVLLLVLPGGLFAQLRGVEELDPPRAFIRNAGQWASVFEYGLLENGNAAMLSREGITFYTRSASLLEDRAVPVEGGRSRTGPFLDIARMGFIEPSKKMRLRARDTSDAVAHFYRGTDAARWHENVSNHRRIAYENVWAGIDAIMENGPSGCRLRFDLAPDADPGRIRLHIADPVADRLPAVWIEHGRDGSAGVVRASLARDGDDTYRIAPVDTAAMVFRITLDFGTYLGGTGDETAFSVVVDEKGEICVTGQTNAVDFPVVDAWQDQCTGGYDRFLTKLSCDGKRILFSSYYGGSNDEDNWVINRQGGTQRAGRRALLGDCLESTPNGYYTVGTTGSPDFPITPDAPVLPVVPDTNGVLLRFNLDGTLKTSMRLGAPGVLAPFAVIADNQGNIIVTGAVLHDRMWFITPGSFQDRIDTVEYRHTLSGAVVKFRADLSDIDFGSYFYVPDGHTKLELEDLNPNDRQTVSEEYPRITPFIDREDNILLLGTALPNHSGRIPLVNGSENVPTDDCSIYATKITPDGSQYIYSTILGGERNDYFGTAVVDQHGNVHIQGQTSSLDYPMKNAFQSHLTMGDQECYTVLAPDGKLLRSSYLYGQFLGEMTLQVTGDVQYFGGWTDSLPYYPQNDSKGWIGCWKPYMITLGGNSFAPIHSAWLTKPNYSPLLGSTWDTRGYVYSLGYGVIKLNLVDDSCFFFEMKNAVQPSIKGGRYDAQLSRFRVDGVSDAFSCDLLLPDSVRVGRHRGLAEPDSFDITVEFSNLAVRDPLRVWYVELELPAGIELDPSTQSPRIRPVPDILGPGMRGAVTWHVRVTRFGFTSDRRIRSRVYYSEPGATGECPPGWGSCEKDLDVRHYDEDEPRLVCALEAPDTLGMAADEASPVRFTVPYRLYTLGGDTARISSVTFGVGNGMGVRLISSSRKVGRTLLPGDTLLLHWDLEAERRPDFRTVTVRAVAEDTWAYPLSTCEDSLTISPVALQCRLDGDDAATYYTGSGTLDHDSLRVSLELTNPADTSQGGITAFFDLSAAAHLRLRSGYPTLLGPFGMDADTLRTDTWWLELKQPIAEAGTDTITVRFRRAGDSTWQECLWLIDLRVFDKNVICSIAAPSAVSVSEVLARDPVVLTCTVTNAGTVPVAVDRYVLEIAPGSGVMSGDPLQRTGGTIDPGNDMSLAWTLRALALRDARTARFSVSAYDAQDEILTACTHEMLIAGVEGLVCMLGSPDTVRFDRPGLRYDPDTAEVLLTLENLLDTEETNIEAVIDLTQAPRFVLAPSESAGKTIAEIDSHSTAHLTWRLIPQPAPRAEDQEVVVRYRSDQMSAWRECRVTIRIDAWPEEISVVCGTGGHDSLHADRYYERIIPDPLQVSYTVTNTGTVALTGCEAAIILPPEFVLAGSDSIQRFTAPAYANPSGGPVPEGTILPNASCTRWWKIIPMQAITNITPKDIRWQWRSEEQGTESSCERTIHIVPGNPAGIVLTPLHLYFEAERGGPLPAEQLVQLWTGGGLAMPWTAQPSEWWLDAQPAGGSQSGQIAVQPNSTQLDEGAHGAEIRFAATPTDRHVAVTYVIRKSTGTSKEPSASDAFTLDVWPLPVPGGTRLHARIGGPPGERCRLTLHDLLGRVRMSREAETGRAVTIDLAATHLTAGMYLLRAVSEDGAQAVRMVSVVW